MSTIFNMTKDVGGYNGFGLKFADDNYTVELDANTPATVTVPSNYEYWLAVFSYEPGITFYVALNDTAQVPTGNTLAASTSQLAPSARVVKGGDVISIISRTNTANANISLYALGNNV